MTINAGTSLNKAREIINAWDFSSIVERSIKKGMHPAQADLALSELREFLFQCSILPDTALSPQSVECDDLLARVHRSRHAGVFFLLHRRVR